MALIGSSGTLAIEAVAYVAHCFIKVHEISTKINHAIFSTYNYFRCMVIMVDIANVWSMLIRGRL